MKEDELRQLAKCCTCRRAIGQLPMPVFHRVNIDRFILNVKAVQRQHGLEQQFNGCVALAQVFSPNEDMAVRLSGATVMICDECMMEKLPQAFIAMEQQEEPTDAADEGKTTEPFTSCAANRDGECNHPDCPQNRDGEPMKSGRHCPLDTHDEDDV